MTATEPLGFGVLVTILAMAAVTYLLRAGGYWLMSHVRITATVRHMLEALPGSIIVATVLPVAIGGGAAAILGIAAALTAMLVRRNELLAVVAGGATAALVRAAGFG